MTRRSGWSIVVLAALLPAIAQGWDDRVHAEFHGRMAQVKTVGIVTPDLKVFELTTHTIPVYQADWTEQARENVVATLERVLRERGLEVRRLSVAPETEESLRDATLLYQAVVSGITQATYANRFPAQKGRFDYTLGDLSEVTGPDVDALVFVWGVGANASGGRRALQTLSAILLGAVSSGVDRLAIAVVARDGQVLWFDPVMSTSSNLVDPMSATSFVKSATDELPREKR